MFRALPAAPDSPRQQNSVPALLSLLLPMCILKFLDNPQH